MRIGRRQREWILGGALALPGLLLVYLLAALLLGLLPSNLRWQEADRGVTVFVRSNGVHTWIVMPKVTPLFDWRPYAPPEHLRDPRYGRSDHIGVGYGQREFYLETPSWSDLKLGTALRAAFGFGDALVHVEHIHRPAPEGWQKPIRLSEDEYRRLTAAVVRSFRMPAGQPQPVLGRGYTGADTFYEAEGGYSALYTCNEWVGDALAEAGVRMGLWTPLEQSIMWRL